MRWLRDFARGRPPVTDRDLRLPAAGMRLDDRFINSPPVTSRVGDRGVEDEGGARTTVDANRTRPVPAVVAGASGPRVSLAPAALRCTSTDTGAPAPDCTPPGTPPSAPRTP